MAVMDDRIHAHHVIELTVHRIEHVARMKVDASATSGLHLIAFGLGSFACQVHQGRGQIDGHHLGAAPRRLHGQGARAATGVQHTPAAEVIRKP